jgi:hypothetical protein
VLHFVESEAEHQPAGTDHPTGSSKTKGKGKGKGKAPATVAAAAAATSAVPDEVGESGRRFTRAARTEAGASAGAGAGAGAGAVESKAVEKSTHPTTSRRRKRAAVQEPTPEPEPEPKPEPEPEQPEPEPEGDAHSPESPPFEDDAATDDDADARAMAEAAVIAAAADAAEEDKEPRRRQRPRRAAAETPEDKFQAELAIAMKLSMENQPARRPGSRNTRSTTIDEEDHTTTTTATTTTSTTTTATAASSTAPTVRNGSRARKQHPASTQPQESPSNVRSSRRGKAVSVIEEASAPPARFLSPAAGGFSAKSVARAEGGALQSSGNTSESGSAPLGQPNPIPMHPAQSQYDSEDPFQGDSFRTQTCNFDEDAAEEEEEEEAEPVEAPPFDQPVHGDDDVEEEEEGQDDSPGPLSQPGDELPIHKSQSPLRKSVVLRRQSLPPANIEEESEPDDQTVQFADDGALKGRARGRAAGKSGSNASAKARTIDSSPSESSEDDDDDESLPMIQVSNRTKHASTTPAVAVIVAADATGHGELAEVNEPEQEDGQDLDEKNGNEDADAMDLSGDLMAPESPVADMTETEAVFGATSAAAEDAATIAAAAASPPVAGSDTPGNVKHNDEANGNGDGPNDTHANVHGDDDDAVDDEADGTSQCLLDDDETMPSQVEAEGTPPRHKHGDPNERTTTPTPQPNHPDEAAAGSLVFKVPSTSRPPAAVDDSENMAESVALLAHTEESDSREHHQRGRSSTALAVDQQRTPNNRGARTDANSNSNTNTDMPNSTSATSDTPGNESLNSEQSEKGGSFDSPDEEKKRQMEARMQFLQQNLGLGDDGMTDTQADVVERMGANLTDTQVKAVLQPGNRRSAGAEAGDADADESYDEDGTINDNNTLHVLNFGDAPLDVDTLPPQDGSANHTAAVNVPARNHQPPPTGKHSAADINDAAMNGATTTEPSDRTVSHADSASATHAAVVGAGAGAAAAVPDSVPTQTVCKVLVTGINQELDSASWKKFRRILTQANGEWIESAVVQPFNERTFNENVTHVMSDADEGCHLRQQTMKLLHGIAAGKWVVGISWMQACVAAGELVPADPHEIVGFEGEEAAGPSAFRCNRAAGEPATLLQDISIHFEGEQHDAFGTKRFEFESLARGGGATVIAEHPGIANELDPDTTIVIVLSDKMDDRRQSRYPAVDPDYLLDCILDYKVHNFEEYDADGADDGSEEDEVEDGDGEGERDDDEVGGDAEVGGPQQLGNGEHDVHADVSQDLNSSPPLF